jgi:hypothetical protein
VAILIFGLMLSIALMGLAATWIARLLTRHTGSPTAVATPHRHRRSGAPPTRAIPPSTLHDRQLFLGGRIPRATSAKLLLSMQSDSP